MYILLSAAVHRLEFKIKKSVTNSSGIYALSSCLNKFQIWKCDCFTKHLSQKQFYDALKKAIFIFSLNFVKMKHAKKFAQRAMLTIKMKNWNF